MCCHVCTTAGQGATNVRADRISQAISASEDAISAAVASGNVRSATAKGKDFAILATRQNTKASDFGRRLQQGGSTRSAAAKHCQPPPLRVRSFKSPAFNSTAAATVLGLQLMAWYKAHQEVKVHPGWHLAVASRWTTGILCMSSVHQLVASKLLLTSSSCAPCLQLLRCCRLAGASNGRSDRISQAISASEDAIAAAAAGGNVRAATTKARAYAVLATRENTKASDFGRKLQQGVPMVIQQLAGKPGLNRRA
jgi:hypothetical protein